MSTAPFFLIGAQRSGTTLLRLMLAAHPRLAIPPESHFIPDLLRLERGPGGLERMREHVARLLANHDRLVDFELGADWISTTVQQLSPLTTQAVTTALFGEYARQQGKARWGDKTPRYRNHLPELCSLFPGARFIHLVRDGRDTALSAWRAPFGPRSWVDAAYLWRDSVRAARDGARWLPPDSFLELRYEALLHEPEPTLRRLCAFLGEDFHPDMLRHTDHAKTMVPSWERSWHAKLERPVEGDNTGKWRAHLSPEQIALFQHIAGAELKLFGYEHVPVDVSTGMAARIAVQRAIHHVMCGVGQALSFVRDPAMTPTALRTGPEHESLWRAVLS